MKHQRIPLSRAYPKASHARREDQAVPYKYRAPGTREGGRKQWKKNRVKKKRQKTERTGERKNPNKTQKKKHSAKARGRRNKGEKQKQKTEFSQQQAPSSIFAQNVSNNSLAEVSLSSTPFHF